MTVVIDDSDSMAGESFSTELLIAVRIDSDAPRSLTRRANLSRPESMASRPEPREPRSLKH
jgi:hypothetical protein